MARVGPVNWYYRSLSLMDWARFQIADLWAKLRRISDLLHCDNGHGGVRLTDCRLDRLVSGSDGWHYQVDLI
jgi:hypothetical protein